MKIILIDSAYNTMHGTQTSHPMPPSKNSIERNGLNLVETLPKRPHISQTSNVTGYCQGYWLLSITLW